MIKLKNLIIEKIELPKINKIFLDMDGVITDFDRRFRELGVGGPENYEKKFGEQKFWNLINAEGIKFWSEMPWTKDGKVLWNYLKDKNVSILSAPSENPDSKNGKRIWVKKELGNIPVILRQAEEKKKLACPDCLLIDDKTDNINQWVSAGGFGIPHKSANDTIKKLKNVLIKEAKETKYIGYKIVGWNGKKAYSLMDKQTVYNIKVGTTHKSPKGLYLGTSRQFVEDYYSGLTDDTDLLLTCEYFNEDIIKGDPTYKNGEIIVRKYKIIKTEKI
jgi:hypothetical protein